MPQSLSEENSQINAHLPPNLIRRIKRHVVARTHGFFAATAPGLEHLCRDELLGIGLAQMPRMVPGGVEFTGRLDVCYRSNLHLRTANRILMRIAEFKATGFGSLEKKASEVPWELFLPPEKGIHIRAAATHSRLMHTGAISERVLKAISSRLGRQATEPPPGKSGQGLFIRAIKDHFTLSIDSSGENLYKRGIKTHGGRAPLRETTAASILKLAGYQPERPLLDPMCGSGSFSIEAAMMSRRIPPGWYRDFAFMHWPAFRPRQWAYIRQAALGGAAPAAAAILASDKDPTVCRRLSETLERCDLCGSVQVVNADFFHMPLPPDRPRPDLPGLIVLNPPYGRRIGSQGESQRLTAAICDKLISDFKGWRFAILAPPGAIPDGFSSRCHTRAFHHGGLKLVLHIGIIGSGPPSGYH